MDDLESWRNRGLRDPADIIEASEARAMKRTHGCWACCRRPMLVGGNGTCRNQGERPGCGFNHDPEVTA